MNLKKFSVALLSLLTMVTFSVSAQPGGGGGMGGGMGGPGGGQGGPGRMQQMNGTTDLLKSAGFFEIEAKTIIKKVKIKDADTQAKVNKLAANFLMGYGDVESTQSEAIEFLKAKTKELKDAAIQASMDPMGDSSSSASASGNRSGGRTQMSDEERAKMQETAEKTRAIRQPMTELHKNLDNGMKAILASDEKLLAKWVEFYTDLCTENGFSTQERGQGQQGQRGQGGQGGQGQGQRGQMGGQE